MLTYQSKLTVNNEKNRPKRRFFWRAKPGLELALFYGQERKPSAQRQAPQVGALFP